MKDLAVSPLRFWFRNINPARPKDEPTPQMVFGSALHCAFFEGNEALESRYARRPLKSDYPGCLVTMEDLQRWLRDKGITPKGTKKEDVIAQVLATKEPVLIFDLIDKRITEENAGKTVLTAEMWDRLTGCLRALRQEPTVCGLMSEGQAEVPLFVKDKEAGVLLKAKLDWKAPKVTLDLKTFAQMRGKSIDKSVTDAIWYEGYHRQAVHYTNIRALLGESRTDYVNVFVESEPPHEVRLRALRPTTGGQPNMYWMRAQSEIDALVWRYADCVKRFCDKPWIDAQEINPLIDEEVPQVAW
ncbi:MAG: PD-(D/E)XK nuclease-like domain-containing protein [Acidobacteriota bacterium]|nr:PD-(D/E)XK nuclease-like domain-containing protein [Acidobacteriota bacterium]